MTTHARVPLRPSASLLPQCHACAHRLVESGLGLRLGLGLGLGSPKAAVQQVRGKKMAKVATIPVRLMQDIPTYGPRGSMLRVSRGHMRNAWYPRGLAEYIPQTEQVKLKLKGVTLPRRRDFKLTEAAATAAPAEEAVVEGKGEGVRSLEGIPSSRREGLSTTRWVEILQARVPAQLDFYRIPIDKAATSSGEEQASLVMTGGVGPVADGEGTAIHGSVSASDVLGSITTALSGDEEASRLRMEDMDISFVVADGEDKTRVRHTGDFETEIRLKGTTSTVRKLVRVLAARRAKGRRE